MLREDKAAITLRELVNGSKKVLPTAVDNASDYLNFSYKDASYVPFLGTRSVQTKAIVQSLDGKSGYTTQITFYDVNEGEKPVFDINPVRVGCSCDSQYFYFSYANWLNNAHIGRKPRAYVPVSNPKRKMPPKNPNNIPGICKHIMAMSLALSSSGQIK